MTIRAAPLAYFGGTLATDLVETVDLTARPDALDGGWWAVTATFEGALTGYRFARLRRTALPTPTTPWPGVAGEWRSSMSRAQYMAAVQQVRGRVETGEVYQVNVCRLLSAQLTDGSADPLALAEILAAGNPARYQGVLHTGSDWLVSASPELFIRRDGDRLTSAPIKGTATPGAPFAAKDTPENVMITDLVRNDLGRLAVPGTVQVDSLLARQELPSLAHLVSTISATVRPGAGWCEIFEALLPPGSVSGAPKHTALQAIRDLEPVPRGVYCGAVGFVDGDRQTAELAVGIRTFFTTDAGRVLNFGTGAGITYLSDPAAEWDETELKAARLTQLASSAGV